MKRAFDCVLAVIALVGCAPIFAIFCLLVATDGGTIFYAHRRVGRDGRIFGCYKFRTMIVGAHDMFDEYLALHPAETAEWTRSQKLDLDPRITGVGKLLRSTSMDELPQLFNVISGEMSLVGPRPITEVELQRYGDHAKDYMTVRPGITGLWQVSGRNRLTYPERVALDMEYIAKQSIWLDCWILLKTIKVLVRRDGK
jgi:lipopolysaccharide/colanic/teichoic acid biosynthesis glycosyltransferase